MLILPLLLAATLAAPPTTAFPVPCSTALPLAQKEADAVVEPGSKAPGGQVLEWTSTEGKPYWYRVPEKIRKKEPPALILMLHGTGMPYGWAFWNYSISKGKFRPNDIVVAPEGMTPGNGDTFNFVQNKNDGEHIAGIIRFFKSKYPIDRVYLYGHSQGAFFCYWFAGEHPELVDGIIAHAGNVLSVRHSKLAKEKVAIGILHGKADAVVTVNCAFRTNDIYRNEGYKKVKLYVVEGLTEQSGHWPLPIQVGEMFEWLDQVTVAKPSTALSVFRDGLQAENPDLTVLSDALQRAETLLDGYKGDDLKQLQAQLTVGQTFMQEVRAAHEAALIESAGSVKSKTPFGAWAAHFSAVDAAFAKDPVWKKSMKKARSLAAKHKKLLDKALAGMSVQNRKAFSAGLAALEKGFLAPRYHELATRMDLLADDPPKGVESKELMRLGDLNSERKDGWDSGLETAHRITAEIAAKFAEADSEETDGE
jgi:predicted esterase